MASPRDAAERLQRVRGSKEATATAIKAGLETPAGEQERPSSTTEAGVSDTAQRLKQVRDPLGRFRKSGPQVVSQRRSFGSTFRLDSDILEGILRPEKLSKYDEMITRTGQWLAALFLGPVIVVSFTLITVLNQLMASILAGSTHPEAQEGIVAFLVTGITLGALVLAAWTWFQFVRTAGFGFFTFED